MQTAFTGDLSRRVKCRKCGESHLKRERLPGVCLSCDLADRWLEKGESVREIAVGLDLPEFLVSEVVGAV